MAILKFTKIILGASLLLFFLSNCATPQVQFSSSQNLQILSQKIGDYSDAGEVVKLGENMPLEKFQGRMLRISSEGKATQYWLLVKPESSQVKIQLQLADADQQKQSGGTIISQRDTPVNLIPRLVIQGVNALYVKNNNLALQSAEQLLKIEPQLASAYYLKGAALSQAGRAQEAKVALAQAKSLDPDDNGILAMLDFLQD